MGETKWIGDALAPRYGGHGSRTQQCQAGKIPPDVQ